MHKAQLCLKTRTLKAVPEVMEECMSALLAMEWDKIKQRTFM